MCVEEQVNLRTIGKAPVLDMKKAGESLFMVMTNPYRMLVLQIPGQESTCHTPSEKKRTRISLQVTILTGICSRSYRNADF